MSHERNGDSNAPDVPPNTLEEFAGILERFDMTLVDWCNRLGVSLDEYSAKNGFTIEEARQRLGDRFGDA